MDRLERNLKAIAQWDASLAARLEARAEANDVAVVQARSGACGFRVGERLEASAEDPEQEGRELAEHLLARAREAGARRLVIFGLPIHALPYLRAFEGSILVIEPSLALLRCVLEHVDLSLALPRVRIVAGESLEDVERHATFTDGAFGVLLSTPTARRRAPEMFERIATRFRPGGDARPLDVLVVPPIHGGSLPIARAAARGLRELGHHVREIDLAPFLPAYGTLDALVPDLRLAAARGAARANLTRLIGQALLAGIHADPPDLVLALAQAPLDAEALRGLRDLGIPRAFWFCEDFRVMTYWQGLARHYDLFFHLQPADFAGPLRAAGGNGVPLPVGFDPEIHRPIELEPTEREAIGGPLVFIGAGYHNRAQFLPGLFDLGLRVYGVDWPGGAPWPEVLAQPGRRQGAEDCNRIFNASDVNLNLHSSPWTDGVNPAGDYLNPRTFELAGAGAFQLVDERRDLGAALQPGSEVETFRDLEECRGKILYFRDHEDERREIAARARSRALAEHTYRHRMELAIDAIRSSGASFHAHRPALPTVGAALDEAPDEAGLRQVLERLDPAERLDASSIERAIRSGEGPLTRDEKLLLFMREAAVEVELRPTEEVA